MANTNIHHITHNGQQLPLCFNMNTWLRFCRLRGIEKFSEAQTLVMASAADMDNISNLETCLQMFWCAFAEGHAKENKPFTLQVDDMADAQLLKAAADLFVQANVPTYNATEDGKTAKKGNA